MIENSSVRMLITDDLHEIRHSKCKMLTKVLIFGVEADIANIFLNEAVPDCVCMTIIDHTGFSDKAQELVRDFYFKQFPVLARRLVEQIQEKGGDIRLLFYLKFFERTPFEGNLANSLYWLALWKLSLDLINPSNVEIRLRSNSSLRWVLSSRRHRRFQWRAIFFLSLQIIRFFMSQSKMALARLAKIPSPSNNSSEALFFTICPSWWVNNGDKGKTERFFPEQILASDSSTAKYLIWFQGGRLRANKQYLRKQLKIDFLVLNDYIKLRDFFTILKRVKDSRILSFFVSSAHHSKATFHNFDISELIQKALLVSVGKGEFVQSHLIELAINRLARYQKPNHVVFRFENQPIDHAIIAALHDNSEVATVGYWHTALSLSKNYIPLWNITYFWSFIGMSHLQDEIWPNFMLVPNKLCKRALEREGFPQNRTYAIPPTRHVDLLTLKAKMLRAHLDFQERHANRAVRVLVSLSADKSTSLLLISTALRCLNLLNGQYLVGIRPHPAWNFSISEVEKSLMYENDSIILQVIWDSHEMYEWISKSKTIVTPGSQLALESMFLGPLPIVFEPKSVFNPTEFDFFSNCCFIVNDSKSMEVALKKVMDGDASIYDVTSNWPNLLEEFLGEVYIESKEVNPKQVMSILSGILPSQD